MSSELKVISWEEYSKHNYPYDCWVLIDGIVYNVTDFLVEHPGGHKVLLAISGLDATAKWVQANHSDYAQSLRNARVLGRIQTEKPSQQYLEMMQKRKAQTTEIKKLVVRSSPIHPQEIALHKSEESCWIILDGKVYDATAYLQKHPGGVQKIMEWAGKDGTKAFNDASHSIDASKLKEDYYIGEALKPPRNLFATLAMVLFAIGVIFMGLRFLK